MSMSPEEFLERHSSLIRTKATQLAVEMLEHYANEGIELSVPVEPEHATLLKMIICGAAGKIMTGSVEKAIQELGGIAGFEMQTETGTEKKGEKCKKLMN